MEKLTKKQKQILMLLLKNEGAFLRASITVSGARDYRLFDSRVNPITKFRTQPIQRLLSYDYLKREDGAMVLNKEKGLTIDMFQKKAKKAKAAA